MLGVVGLKINAVSQKGGLMTECPKCGHENQPGDTECSHCGTDFSYIQSKQAEKEARQAQEKAQAAEIKMAKERVSSRLSELIEKMDDDQLACLLEAAEGLFGKKKRIHERVECLITADCVYQNRAVNHFVKDISLGGVFIETSESFSEGEEITMTLSFSHHLKPFKITGIIVRSTPNGIGVQFKTMSQVQQELIQNIVKQVAKFKK